MIGRLVYFDYAEDPANICVVLSMLRKEDLDDDEDLYLLYDFNYRDYYYASIEEIYPIRVTEVA
tara:strand:+ start:412 stop:603 length:192 start_codon:yes stop_codon:yes gene_type:complete